jgi:hypothetical protein
MSQDDLDEIINYFGECQAGVDSAKERCKKVSTGITFKKFLFSTIPGNIIMVLLIFTLLQLFLQK